MTEPTIIDMVPSGAAYKQSLLKRPRPLILVQMDKLFKDHSVCGETISIDPMLPNVVPFSMKPSFWVRWQYPLEPASSSTTHKCQGLTATHGVVLDIPPTRLFTFALAYVALSRSTTVENDQELLLSPLLEKHFSIPEGYKTLIQNEYTRLRSLSNTYTNKY